MSAHLVIAVDALKRKLLSLSTLAEESVHLAVRAVLERDRELSAQVLGRDNEIDRLEVEIEEDCLKLLALHQPVATDLRFIIAALKMNNDLERIGDLATNIAARGASLIDLPAIASPIDLEELSRLTKKMLRDSIDSLVKLDAGLAESVCLADAEVDALHREMYKEIQKQVREHPQQVEILMLYLAVSRNLERTADLATNIAEDVIYMIRGDIVRHRWNIDSKNPRRELGK